MRPSRPVLLLAALALVTAAVATAATAQDPVPIRIAADDPTTFAIELSQAVYDDAGGSSATATHAVLGRADVFADTLAAGPLLSGGPLLYVPGGPAGTLPGAVAAELQRILPPGSPVYLAGGTDAVSQDVEDAVATLGYLTIRAGGPERTATAAAIAEEAVRLLEGTTGDGTPDVVLVALAGNWPDAIAGASLAASEQHPILLTDGGAASAAATDFIAAHPTAEVWVLGGDAVISEAVFQQLEGDRRLAGPTRMHTSAAIAAASADEVRGTSLINGYPDDGWVQGNAAAVLLQPLLLAGPTADDVPDVILDALRGRDGDLHVLGGTDRVSELALTTAEAAR